MSDRPTVTVEPREALADEALSIRAVGFAPGDTVDVQARLTDGFGVTWESAAAYQIDQEGALDLAATPPQEADDETADPMRLIWSMRPVDQPKAMVYRAPPDLSDELVEFTVADRQGNAAHAGILRRHLPPDVRRTVVAEAGVWGTLFVPDGQQARAAIVVLSSSVGGVNERDAALYAAHGYTALALAYFNYEELPRVLSHIPLEYFENAVNWLSGLDCVDEDRLAITGRSRGGEGALLVGATSPRIKCVLADVPSGLIWEGYGIDERRPSPAWTYRGAPLPFLPQQAYAAIEQRSLSGEPEWCEARFLEQAGITVGELRGCEIPVENTDGGILLISAEDDRVWPSTCLSQVAEQRLVRSGFRHPFEHASYRGAGHFVVAPYTPTTIQTVTHPVTGETYDLGGTPEGTYAAGVDAWQRKLEFLEATMR